MQTSVTRNEYDLKQKVNLAVSSYFGVDPWQIDEKCRKENVVVARFMAYYILHIYYALTLPEIGKLYNRDHTTILNGVKRIGYLGLEGIAQKFFQDRFIHIIHTPNSNKGL